MYHINCFITLLLFSAVIRVFVQSIQQTPIQNNNYISFSYWTSFSYSSFEKYLIPTAFLLGNINKIN